MADIVKFSKAFDDKIKAGDVFVAKESVSRLFARITAGKEYTVVPATCGCCTWAVKDDAGDLRTAEDRLPEMIRKDPVSFAPVYTPALEFRDLRKTDQGVILLAKMQGKPLQSFSWDTEKWTDYTGPILEDGIYRLTPQSLLDANARRNELIAKLSPTTAAA